MELTAVRCNHCGAPLEVGADTRFVTCKFCGTELAVKRTDSSAFTEVVAELAAKTDAMSGNLKVIELQNEVERLDREWDMGKERFYVARKDGSRSLPSAAGSVVGAIFGSVILVAWIAFATKMGAPAFFPIFGAVVMVGFLINMAFNLSKSGQLKRAGEVHQQKRSALLEQIEAARGSRD